MKEITEIINELSTSIERSMYYLTEEDVNNLKYKLNTVINGISKSYENRKY